MFILNAKIHDYYIIKIIWIRCDRKAKKI